MCGICGFTSKSNETILKSMADSIYHRGPDEEGFYTDDKINLGIRRLSIIDVTTGHQPVHNENKNIWVVFNGEIYNFKELRKDLQKRGHQFYTDHSDTETIVHLYEEYGENFVHKINGMFAIALWDKTANKLILIRDRMGVKPLFYAVVNGVLIFGSEIKAILAHPAYHREINFEAIYHYFTFKNITAPMTAFKDIFSLVPGELLTFTEGRVSKRRWWKLRFDECQNYDEAFVTERISILLEDATRLRMVSDVPFGAYLSGGVDSSAVVALMTRFTDKPVKTFSLGYEDELKNKEADLYFARKVSKAYNTEHYEYVMSHKELTNEIPQVISSFDQPFSGTISTFFLSKLIKKHVKVALSGDGADELFGSYLSHRTAQPMFHLRRLYAKLQNNSLTDEDKILLAPCDIHFLKDLYDRTQGDEASWRFSLFLFSDKEKDDLFSDKFKSQTIGVRSFELVQREFQELTTSKDPLNRILELEWNTIFPDQVLAFVDILSMAHSVEIRSPFLDYRLVEFAATIPGTMKINRGNVKDILKRSVGTILPEGVIARPKEGFVLPIFDWMNEQLKNYCKDILSEKRIGRHGFFNSDVVKSLVMRYYGGDRSLAGRVWNLMMFQVWWEGYFG